jgi:predicted PurR-regulated permease PerM
MRFRWRNSFFGPDRIFPRLELRKGEKGNYALWLLAVVALVGIAAYAGPVLVPTAAAVVLYYAFAPLKRRLMRHGVGPLPFAVGIVAGLVLLLFAGVSMLAAPIGAWIENGSAMVFKVEQKLGAVMGPVEKMREVTDRVERMTKPAGETGAGVATVGRRSLSGRIFGGFSDFVVTVGASLVLLFYLLVRPAPPERPLIGLFGTFGTRRRVYRAIRQAERDLAEYMRTIAAINACLGALLSLAFYAIGLPGALVLGVIAGLLNFIPLLGGIATIVLTFVIGVASFDALGEALLAPGVSALMHAVEANIVTPAILGRRLTLDPFLVILALLIGAWLWGIAGALLAVPLLLFAAAAWRAYLGAKPAPAVQAAPEATLAQPANPTRA